VGSKHPIACNNCRHTPSWRFYLHSRIEETSSPEIICIVCHQVLRHPSEHGTRSMGIHLLAKVHIAKSNELTELEVSKLTSTTVDETELAILKRQGCRRISAVSWQRVFISDNWILSILIKFTDKPLYCGSCGHSNGQISPSPLDSLPHVRIYFSFYSMERYIKPGATTDI